VIAKRSGLTHYANLGGDSGVVAYAIGASSIVVEFSNGWKYEYTAASVGAERLAEMQRRARAGRGLSTLIAQQAHADYARKFR
jgi:hypothetical protein